MINIQERWALFIDFAATLHELLTDAKQELEQARLIETVPLFVLQRLDRHWQRICRDLDTFTEVSKGIQKDTHLTQSQINTAVNVIAKINEAARQADASLRLFSQEKGVELNPPPDKFQ